MQYQRWSDGPCGFGKDEPRFRSTLRNSHLVKSLSAILSTASLDKNPQSRQRGITLDLGFSAFISDLPSTVTSGNVADV